MALLGILSLITVALKLFAEALEVFSRSEDVLNRPKSARVLLDFKAILNMAAGASAVSAALTLLVGPDVIWYWILGVLVVLLLATAIVAALVWRETPTDGERRRLWRWKRSGRTVRIPNRGQAAPDRV